MIGHEGSSYYGFSGLLHASDKFLSRADHDSCKYFMLSIGKSKIDFTWIEIYENHNPSYTHKKLKKECTLRRVRKEKIKAGENLKK